MNDLPEPQSMELPTPNLPLLRKVLDHIDAHPDEYDQRAWVLPTSCGTAYCVAGTALVMSGHTLEAKLCEDDGADPIDRLQVTHMDGQYANPRTIQEVARRELGLTSTEAHFLFDERNCRADVQTLAEDIAARAGERL